MQKTNLLRNVVIALGIMAISALACQLPGSPSTPSVEGEPLFQGISYSREVRTSPRSMVIHVVTIDLREQGIGLFVTPGNPKRELPSDARTTSQFLDEFGVQIAINGDGFTPWSTNPLDPYPRSGEPVDPLGLAVSGGETYSEPRDNVPVLYVTPAGKVQFNDPPNNIAYAISGLELVVTNGNPAGGLDGENEPRTAIGLNRANNKLILVVVDGRQPGYSEGATLSELAAILLEYGAHNAMNMDGGGSSTLVMEAEDGQPTILNSPIDGNVPGNERPVANHLGIFAKKK